MCPPWDSSGQSDHPSAGGKCCSIGGGHLVTTSSAKQELRWLLALGSPAPHVPRPICAHWHMGSALAVLPWELHSKSIARHPESPGLRIPGASECPGEPPPLLLPSLTPAAPGSAPGHTPQGLGPAQAPGTSPLWLCPALGARSVQAPSPAWLQPQGNLALPAPLSQTHHPQPHSTGFA